MTASERPPLISSDRYSESNTRIVTREKPWRIWRLLSGVIVLGLCAVWGVEAWSIGPTNFLGDLLLVWPGLVLLTSLTGLGVLFVELAAEPRNIEVSDAGISFGGRLGRQVWKWNDLGGPDAKGLGIWLRKKGPRSRIGFLPSPNQWSAILSHPSCPRWEIPRELRARLGGDFSETAPLYSTE